MKHSLILIIALNLTYNLFSQRNLQFLQLEKVGSMKVEKISLGTVITYSLKDGQGWYTSELANFLHKVYEQTHSPLYNKNSYKKK